MHSKNTQRFSFTCRTDDLPREPSLEETRLQAKAVPKTHLSGTRGHGSRWPLVPGNPRVIIAGSSVQLRKFRLVNPNVVIGRIRIARRRSIKKKDVQIWGRRTRSGLRPRHIEVDSLDVTWQRNLLEFRKRRIRQVEAGIGSGQIVSLPSVLRHLEPID